MQTRLLTLAASTLIAASQTHAAITTHATWQVSTDNGTSWLQSTTVPQSQSSVLVRAVITTSFNYAPVASGSTPALVYAVFETYSTTLAPNNDTATDFRRAATNAQGDLILVGPATMASRRVGNVLAIDRAGDLAPLGTNQGIIFDNTFGGIIQPTLSNNIVLMQYRLVLDNTAGDRVLSGAFLPFDAFGVQASINQVATSDPFTGSNRQATDITQSPATITVIPAPTTATLFTITALGMLRRRRA